MDTGADLLAKVNVLVSTPSHQHELTLLQRRLAARPVVEQGP